METSLSTFRSLQPARFWMSQVVYLPCTALVPQGVRQWTEHRRVVNVCATCSTWCLRTEAIVSLESDPSGAVHALATRMTQGVNGLGEGVTSSVARLWSGFAKSHDAETPPSVVATSPTRLPQVPAHVSSPAVAPSASSPPRYALQNELASELQQQRSKVAQREVVFERVGSNEQTIQPAGALAPDLFDFERRTVTTTVEQRRAVLTINDALELLDEVTLSDPAPRELGPVASKVHRHLDSATEHLQRAANLGSSLGGDGGHPVAKAKATMTGVAPGIDIDGRQRHRRRRAKHKIV